MTDDVPPTLTGFMRLNKVLEIYPVSEAHWWKGIKDGIHPKPYKRLIISIDYF